MVGGFLVYLKGMTVEAVSKNNPFGPKKIM